MDAPDLTIAGRTDVEPGDTITVHGGYASFDGVYRVREVAFDPREQESLIYLEEAG